MIERKHEFRCVVLSGLEDVARRIAEQTTAYKIWLFNGDLGAGKTTLIKEICKALGVTDAMSSPTFAIVNEYEAKGRQKIFHFDFYRIKTETEAYDLGIEEYFYSGNLCFIEWPEKISSLIPETYGRVNINIDNESQRTIAISVHDGQEENRV